MSEPIPVTTPNQKPKEKHGCLTGCLVGLLVLVIVAGGIAVTGWILLTKPFPSKAVRALQKSPSNASAQLAIKEQLSTAGLKEPVDVLVLVAPDENGSLTGESGSIALVSFDFSTSALSKDAIRQRARQLIASQVAANEQAGADIRRSAYYCRDGDKTVLTLSAPIDQQQAWLSGKITETEFLKSVGVKLNDLSYFREILDAWIGDAIFDSLFGKFLG